MKLISNKKKKSCNISTGKCFHFTYHVHAKSKSEAGRFRLKFEFIGLVNEDGLEARVSGVNNLMSIRHNWIEI